MRKVSLSITALPRRIGRNTSVATRLSLIVLIVALSSLVIASVVGLERGNQLADRVARNELSALAASRAAQVELYVESLRRTAIAQALTPSAATAIRQFGDAYRELQAQRPPAEDEALLAEYYNGTVAPQLEEVRGQPVSAASLVPSDPAAIYLQANYVIPASTNDAAFNADAGDGSTWSEVSRSLSGALNEVAIRSDVDDLYLIEAGNNTIVYSSSNGIDFATSLRSGPHSGTALAALVNSLAVQPERGTAVITDYTRYAAAGDQPSVFVASPVIEDGVLVGFVAFRIGARQISAITTNGESWENLFPTGETYLVAADDRLRSDARAFVEDPVGYVEAALAAGTLTEDDGRFMEELGTTTLFQPVEGAEVDAALSGEPGIAEETNFLGHEVLSAYRGLNIDGLDWAVFASVDRDEIDAPKQDFVRNLLIAIALFIVAITFIAMRWSSRLLEPLKRISAGLRTVRATGVTELGAGSTAMPDNAPQEFADFASDIDAMMETLSQANATAEERISERRDLLRRLLPPQVVRRAESGEQDVLDTVANATVAVVVLHGLGALLRGGSAGDARTFVDQFITDADALATQRGLDRVRLTGDAYYASCGTSRPHLDHAQRAAWFVLDVRELIRDLAADESVAVTVGAGLDSGPVTVGLTGGSRLVYDAWGTTVQTAAELARRAAPSQILASESTRMQLPASFATEEYSGPTGPTGVAVVTGHVSEAEQVS